ncbi:MAG: tRNA pseudouridine(55) synthase TruB [Proteobacteria bacterium]|nr:tRNA pseudouridine(55) synthase TruB [Pseudomonadota bacterium]
MDGILNVFKPEGITSYDVIRKVKRIAGENKIGHTGTLDPFAQGVLPLFLGKMTKLIPCFNLDDKTYSVGARLGARSSTLDREGDIVEIPIPSKCDDQLVEETLRSFVGEIDQIPPMFSAVKVNGKKLYQYARKGQEVERKSRRVTVFWIRNIRCRLPNFSFEMRCSKGTYVRTLVDDLAKKMDTGAYLTELTRTRCGSFFRSETAVKLEGIENSDKFDLQRNFIDPQYILPDWHIVEVDSPEMQKRISQGRSIPVPLDKVRFSDLGKRFEKSMAKDRSDKLIAIGTLEFSQDSQCNFRPSKVLV